jgi:hypothetical protein
VRYNDVDTDLGDAEYTSSGVSLTAAQPLYRRENQVQYQQAKEQVKIADVQFRAAEQDLILRVAQAYFDVLQSQDNIAFIDAQKSAITEQLAAAKRNFEVGTTTITDTHEAQARYDLAVAQEIAEINNNQNFGTQQVDTRTASIGVELNLPIYQGGLTSSRVREAVANQERARQDLEFATREAGLQARQAWLNVNSGVARVRALEQALISTQAQLDSTKLGLDVGVRTNLDVLDAEQQVLSARRDLAAARYAYLLSALALKAAVGTLSPADLAELDQHREVLARFSASARGEPPKRFRRHRSAADGAAPAPAAPRPARARQRRAATAPPRLRACSPRAAPGAAPMPLSRPRRVRSWSAGGAMSNLRLPVTCTDDAPSFSRRAASASVCAAMISIRSRHARVSAGSRA